MRCSHSALIGALSAGFGLLACGGGQASLPLEDACAALLAPPGGPVVRLADPEAGLTDLVDHPFPSDALVGPDGRLMLDHFPNPTRSTTLQDYLQIFRAEIRGYATSAALYVGFDAAMDPASFPTDPGAALEDDAPVFLVDIDPDSPQRGRRYPLWLRYRAEPSLYLPAHHLIALPPFGATLRGGTTYALVLTSRVRSASGVPLARSSTLSLALSEACGGRAPAAIRAALAPLAAWLATEPAPERVVGATVFTTRDAVGQMRALATAVRAAPAPTATGWRAAGQTSAAGRFDAEIDLPGVQAGTRPYAAIVDGGALARGADGRFVVDHRETSRLAVNVPKNRPMPAEGWPVVLFSHGTGGDYASVRRASGPNLPPYSERLAELGIATIGYDGALHGPRDPTGADPNLTFFNLFNPVAARDNVRQGAVDLVALAEALPALLVPASIAGVAHRFDPDRYAVVGHSQGALVGAPFLAADNSARAMVFSGLGAILTITLLERKDIVDFAALLSLLLALPPDAPLDDLHPVVNLFQQFIEPADPIAYARSFRESPSPGSSTAILMVEGFEDFASPARGQEAFSVAAGLPVVMPVFRSPDAARWLGPAPAPAPASNNVDTDLGVTTYGLIQYPDETHFPIFRNEDANRRTVEFLRSVLIDGVAVIPATQ